MRRFKAIYTNFHHNYVIFQTIHNLAHNWTIIDQETYQIYASSKSKKLVIRFAKPGAYKLLVLIDYNGSVLSSSYIISVESK